jgi:hypothetical protein
MNFQALSRLAHVLADRAARRFVVRTCIAAPLVRASLVIAGFDKTRRWIAAIPLGPAKADAVDLSDGMRLVSCVFRFNPLGGTCLPQALTQHLVHRLDGTPSRFVVGVRRGELGVEAHAWVEAEEPSPSNETFSAIFISDSASIEVAE